MDTGGSINEGTEEFRNKRRITGCLPAGSCKTIEASGLRGLSPRGKASIHGKGNSGANAAQSPQRNSSARIANRSFDRSRHDHNTKKTRTEGSRFSALTAIGNLVKEGTWRSMQRRNIKKSSWDFHFRGISFILILSAKEKMSQLTEGDRK